MPCYHPLRSFQLPDGTVKVLGAKGARLPTGSRALLLPCGQCIGCRLERARGWAIRCMHEASLYDSNLFVTLTYNDEHLPADLSLHHEHYVLFQKRLRYHAGYQPRYYMCGEYGEARGRPHYHACLFNLRFKDQLFYSSRGGNKIYTSATLDKLWGLGDCKIGALTFESAAYVARYCTEVVTGERANEAYQLIDKTTGELHQRKPEYNEMSRRPGIGAPWLQKYHSDVYPFGECLVRGRKGKPPRYYDTVFRRDYDNNDTIYKQIVERRAERAILKADDQRKERRLTREKVAELNLNRKRKTQL